MISELAKLLRISLSKGRTVIRIADEIQHSTSYMNIQKVRYKERFATEFIIDEEINDYCTVKLIVQPILENAIYYGVGNMDEDDGGKITVRGEKKGDDILFFKGGEEVSRIRGLVKRNALEEEVGKLL